MIILQDGYSKIFFIFILSWILVGFLTLLFLIINYLRKSEYDKKHLKKFFDVTDWLFVIAMGYFSPIIVFIKYISNNLNSKKDNIYECLYNTLYKIANIGVNKTSNNKEEGRAEKDEVV